MIFKESDKVELKKSTAQLDEALKTACGFLNHKGGTVYFGVRDDGKPLGMQIADTSFRKLSQQVAGRVRPEITPELGEIKHEGKLILYMKVPEGNNKPYFLNGIAYMRVGTEDRIIPPDELGRIYRDKRSTNWDEEICMETSYKDINMKALRLFRERYGEMKKSSINATDRMLLKSLRCIKEDHLTNGGVLLFAKQPVIFFPMSYITIVRYPGKEIEKAYLDIRDFHGNLFEIVNLANDYLKEHVIEYSQVEEDKIARTLIPQYSYFAIRELITNAVVHRDYSILGSRIIIRMFRDRIEFNSPGSLPGNITPKNIMHEQFSRNPVIAETFNKIMFIEKLGEGWDRIMVEAKENPFKPKLPEIMDTGNTVIATLHSPEKFLNKPIMSQFEPIINRLNERQIKVVKYLQENDKITRVEYQKLADVSKRTAVRDLNELQDKRILLVVGKARAQHYELNRATELAR